MTTKSLNQKDTAKAIRQHLKASYPNTKFSVRMSPASQYIYVSYEDGPAESALNTELAKFCDQRFDGMTDSYMNIGVSGYSCSGVIVRRSYSEDALAFANSNVQITVDGTPYVIDPLGRQYHSGAYGFEARKNEVIRHFLAASNL